MTLGRAFRKASLAGITIAAALAFMNSTASEAKADHRRRVSVSFSFGPSYGYGYGSDVVGHRGLSRFGYDGPIYHAPSVHYHRVYHPEYSHWTPHRGLHTHGHYDYVPHYTPGHFDRYHRDHIDLNPHFHD
jgi:hypothetical protein